MPGHSCAIATCNSKYRGKGAKKNDDVSFFTWPRDEKIGREWQRLCDRPASFDETGKRVCSLHFTRDDFDDGLRAELLNLRPKILKKTAIPSLNLPPACMSSERNLRAQKRKDEREKKILLENLLQDEAPQTVFYKHWSLHEELGPLTSPIIKVENERVTSEDSVVELTEGQSKLNSDSYIVIKIKEEVSEEDLDIKQELEDNIEIPDDVSAEDISTLSHDIKIETEECDLSQIKMETEESNSTSASSEQTKHVTNNTLEDDLCVEQPEQFICAICNKSFTSKYSLIQHIKQKGKRRKSNTGEKLHAFQYCPFKALRLNDLKRHTLIHTGEKRHACQYCPYISLRLNDIKRHMSTHTVEKTHKCQYCPFKTTQASYLKKHMLTHTREKTHACQYCPYTSLRLSDIKRHMSTHTGEKPHACQYCPYKANDKHNLKRHILTHSDEKPHSCQYCPYKARHLNGLQIHMLTHTGEKPHVCQYCPYKSRTAGHLKVHVLTHTGEKPHSCQYCPFKARSTSELKVHTFRHTGEKPYACQYCPYKSRTGSNLKRHMLGHTAEMPHACQYCSYKAKAAGHLKNHVLLTHTTGK